MNTGNRSFNATELCSRKLWQLVNNREQTIGERELRQAVHELTERRHYLQELQQLGKLEQH